MSHLRSTQHGLRESEVEFKIKTPSALIATAKSAVEQAGIELEVDWWCNANAFEVPVFGIEEKICVGGTHGTRQGDYRGSPLDNPTVADFPRFHWRGVDPPVRRQFFRRKNFRYAIGPLQVKGFKFIDRKKRPVIDEYLQRCSGLMLAHVNCTHTWRVPSSSVATGTRTCVIQRNGTSETVLRKF